MIDYETYRMGDDDQILVIAVSGSLDSEGSGYFFDCVKGFIEAGNHRIVIDCRNVDYISSLGLGTLVRAHSRMKKFGGDVKLARIEGFVADVLKTVGLHRLFHLYPTVREACASFEDSHPVDS